MRQDSYMHVVLTYLAAIASQYKSMSQHSPVRQVTTILIELREQQNTKITLTMITCIAQTEKDTQRCASPEHNLDV